MGQAERSLTKTSELTEEEEEGMGQVIWYPSWMIGPKDRLKSVVPEVLKFPICDPKKG
jgi:hypothetical protein